MKAKPDWVKYYENRRLAQNGKINKNYFFP